MRFDGFVGRDGAGFGIWIINPRDESNFFSYNLNFHYINNMEKYEALVLGLKALKDLGAKKISFFGDSNLVIKQVNGTYQTKDARMRAYRNLILKLLESFEEHDSTIKPREYNGITDSLVVSTSQFTILTHSIRNMRLKSDIGQPFLIRQKASRYLKMIKKSTISWN